MCTCKDCKHSKFDHKWGEYKCLKLHRRLYILLNEDECQYFEKRTTPIEVPEEEEK